MRRLDRIRAARPAAGFWAMLLGAAVAAHSAPSLAAWTALSGLGHSGARVSAAAVDLHTGRVIEQLDAASRLRPASLTKLVTAAAVLQAWPAGKLFRTRLLTAGHVTGHTLDGALILRGAGDPSLDDESLWSLAVQLRGDGIRSISGPLLVSPAPFGAIPCSTVDRCAALHRSDNAYNAPIASLGIDFGSWCLLVTPTRPGRAARVHGCATARLPVPVIGQVATAPAGARRTLTVERDTTARGDVLRVAGEVPQGAAQRVYRAMSDPALGAGLLLAEALRELGVHLSGAVQVSDRPLPASARVLANVEGLTLGEQVGRMLRFSNNYIADVLTMDLAASGVSGPVSGLAPRSLRAATQAALVRWMSRLRPVPASVPDPPPPPLASGSGLSRDNRLSADDLIALLARQYRDARDFPAFYGGLTVPSDAPFAFLRGGNAAWLDRVALKTGTMNEPVSVCGVAGYLRTHTGGWIAFAVIINGGPRWRHIPIDTAMHAVRTDVEALLARE